MAGPTIDYTNAATASGDVFSNQWRIVDASVAVYSTSYDGVPYSELHQRARFARKHKYYVSGHVISYNTFLTASLHLGEAMCIIAVFEYAVVQYLLAREKRALAAHGRYAANRAHRRAPEDDPKAPTAVAPEGWGSTVGDIVDAGEDPATPI
ncbi:hypothetical protein JL722_13651 [Aureococcus anophagefferens]|nr:hypothetical protein JL722_13651 [Aureococcus anophagefferens]